MMNVLMSNLKLFTTMKKIYLEPTITVLTTEHILPIATSLVAGGNASESLGQDDEGDVKASSGDWDIFDYDK